MAKSPLPIAGLAVLVVLFAAAEAPAQPADAKARNFPRGFLWGTAISGFQTEAGGRPLNADRRSDWWRWVHDRRNLDEGIVTRDRIEDGPGHWNRYRSDVDLAARSLHLNAFRLGIEWSRIFPRSTEGIRTGRSVSLGELRRLDRLADRRAVQHYRAELARIRSRGMTAFVTLNHFTLPVWIHDPIAVRNAFAGRGPDDPLPAGLERAGWLSRTTVEEFRKLAAYAAWRFGDLADLWTPINEPLVVVASGFVNIPGVLAGNFPPGIWSFTGAVRAINNLLDANAAAYDAVKARDRRNVGGVRGAGRGRSAAEVGLVQNMPAFTPADPSRPEDVMATDHADYLFNRLFVNAAVRGEFDADFDQVEDSGERPAGPRKADFLGVNYYFRARVSALEGSLTPRIPVLDFLPAQSYRSSLHPDDPPCPTECSDLGNEIYPQGFRDVLALAGTYGIPVYVTENGIADADDDQRRRFLRDHLRAMHDAIEVDGVREVRGYFHWSLLDNFEWAEGYGPRFGLYSVVPGSPARRARPSARLYARIARANGLPAD